MLHGMFFFVADPSHIEFWRNWLIGYIFRCRKLFYDRTHLKVQDPLTIFYRRYMPMRLQKLNL